MIVMTVIGAVLRPFARQRRWRSSVTRGATRESSGKRSEDGDDDRRGEHRANCINHHARRPVGIRRAELGPDHRHLHRALVEASRRSRDRSAGSARCDDPERQWRREIISDARETRSRQPSHPSRVLPPALTFHMVGRLECFWRRGWAGEGVRQIVGPSRSEHRCRQHDNDDALKANVCPRQATNGQMPRRRPRRTSSGGCR